MASPPLRRRVQVALVLDGDSDVGEQRLIFARELGCFEPLPAPPSPEVRVPMRACGDRLRSIALAWRLFYPEICHCILRAIWRTFCLSDRCCGKQFRFRSRIALRSLRNLLVVKCWATSWGVVPQVGILCASRSQLIRAWLGPDGADTHSRIARAVAAQVEFRSAR